ncbi:MAG: rod shape-determining protein MreD [Pseudomonadota bacterium]|nr:rod shape-determining protein MreD [Pseudomonadota bacterium]
MIFLVTWLSTLFFIVIPYPAWMTLALPHFGFLFVTWWGLMRNYQLSMTLLLISSLPIDVLYGTTLGLHGLLFALIAYALTLLGPSIRQVNWIRQSLVVFGVLLIASAVSYWARTLTGQTPDFMILILQSVVSAFLWSPLRWFYDMVAQYAEGLRAQSQ